jgi:hypothetical protein
MKKIRTATFALGFENKIVGSLESELDCMESLWTLIKGIESSKTILNVRDVTRVSYKLLKNPWP